PGLDRGGRGRQAAPALGLAGDVGHLRTRPLQLRVHDRREEGDHVALPGGRHLHQPVGRLRNVLLRALPEELPGGGGARADPHHPARRAYILWRQQRLFDLWRLWDAEVRKINSDSCVIPNTGGGATSSLDMRRVGELAPMLVADRQARRGLTAPWANGKNGKEYRAAMGRKPIVGIFSVGVEEPHRWKDRVAGGAAVRVRAGEGGGDGLSPRGRNS